MNKRQMEKHYMETRSDYRITLDVIKKAKKKIRSRKRKIMIMLGTSKIIHPACEGYGYGIGKCEYNGIIMCKNPHAISPVMTSTAYGAYPSGCPKMYDWNYKDINNESGETK